MRFEQGWSAESPIADLQMLASRARRARACFGALLPAVAVLLCGCSGVVSGQNTAPIAPPLTFSISGTISPVAGGNGATVTLSGTASATTTADSSGNFTLSGLANGTYTITPSHAGYGFSPSSMNVTINDSNVTTGINFTATALTFGIS